MERGEHETPTAATTMTITTSVVRGPFVTVSCMLCPLSVSFFFFFLKEEKKQQHY